MNSELLTMKPRVFITFASVALLLASFSGRCAGGDGEPVKDISSNPSESLASKWGIQVSSLRLTAGEHFMDFRYKVLDPEKAAPLGKLENKAYLIDQASGMKFQVPTTPKAGQLRQSAQKLTAGRIYFVLFANPGKFVKVGNKVTVVIGDCRVEDLTVE